jgi:hypothetical protein
MKNFPFELSIKIMLIVYKKELQKHRNFFMNISGNMKFEAQNAIIQSLIRRLQS